MINVIDTDDYEASGIEVFQFPGGEWHANVPTWPRNHVHIFAKLRSWDDMGKLLVVTSALNCQQVRIDLFCPYLPGARQDRNPGGNTPATAKLYAWLFQNFVKTTTVVDIHSEAAAAAFHPAHIRRLDPRVFLKDLIKDDPDLVIAPDKGAHERATKAADLFGSYCGYASKNRDFGTGKLTGFTAPVILSDVAYGARILIVDDICDGGGTFVGLLDEIRKQNHTGPVDLYVTHGIFSKGMEVLNGFDNVYTTDSFWRRSDEVTRPGDVGIKWPHTIGLLPYYFGGLHP